MCVSKVLKNPDLEKRFKAHYRIKGMMKGYFILKSIAVFSFIYHFNRLAKHWVHDKPEASDEAKVPNIE